MLYFSPSFVLADRKAEGQTPEASSRDEQASFYAGELGASLLVPVRASKVLQRHSNSPYVSDAALNKGRDSRWCVQ